MPSVVVGAFSNSSRATGSGGSPWSTPAAPGHAATTYANDGFVAVNSSGSLSDSESLDGVTFKDISTLLPVDWTGKTITGMTVSLFGGVQGFNSNVAIIAAQNGNLGNNSSLGTQASPWAIGGAYAGWNYLSGLVGTAWVNFIRDRLLANDLLISLINSPQGLNQLDIDRLNIQVDYDEAPPPATAQGFFAMEF